MREIQILTHVLVYVPETSSGFVFCPREMYRASWETDPDPYETNDLKLLARNRIRSKTLQVAHKTCRVEIKTQNQQRGNVVLRKPLQ